MELQKYTTTFENKSLTVYRWNDTPVFIATEVGEAAGYKEGRSFVDNITGRWSDEIIDGTYYFKLEGEGLHRFKEQFKGSSESLEGGRVVLLTEIGVNLALMKGRTPLCKKLRLFLATEVIPKLVRGEAIVPEKTSFEIEADLHLRVYEAERENFRMEAMLIACRYIQERLTANSIPRENGEAILTTLLHKLTGVPFPGAGKLIRPDLMSPTELGQRLNLSPSMVGRIVTWIEEKRNVDLRNNPNFAVREIVPAANQSEDKLLHDVEGYKLTEEGVEVFKKLFPEYVKAHPASVAAKPSGKNKKNAIRKTIEKAAADAPRPLKKTEGEGSP
jgi:prophage antirepressor-like protein